ncbi:hypothetical protein QYE76_024855 [Lolium multiflorum]|uniref:Transposase (putative) gypsy type domain-containing protein n=1 Tax=Lolium multiflorum TaxID=4521 RepID=A0AAD8VWG0_LOLMU|nr:hypothetical protein QYE76_024855 [Lolium multiflorum]
MTKAWVERGLSLPCSEFFLSVLDTYGLQPHNICPNSYLLLSNFATLCEGHRNPTRHQTMAILFPSEERDEGQGHAKLRKYDVHARFHGRMYPPHDSHESVRSLERRMVLCEERVVPSVHDGLPSNTPPEELASWSFIPTLCPITHTGEGCAEDFCLTLWRRKTYAPYSEFPLAVTRWKRIRKTPRRKKNECPKGCSSTYKAFPRKVSARRRRSGELPPRNPGNPNPTTARTNVRSISLSICRRNLPPLAFDASSAESSTSPRPSPPPADRSQLCSTHSTEVMVSSEQRAEMVPGGKGPINDETDETGEAKLILQQGEATTALHYELHKNIALQRRVTISQAEKIQCLQAENADLKKQLSEAQGASSSLAAASSELETLRASQKNLEAKLAVAEQKISEKNSELARKTGEFELKRQTDSDTIQKQQREIGGLRKYMETAESCWDLPNSDVMDPLGYDEERRSQFPRDDLLQLAGEDCKDLISASRKICHNLNIKKSRTCDVRKLIKRMDLLPELVVDLQSSSARGAAAMSLAMCLGHNPSLNLDRVTSGVPPECDVNALLDAISGYDTRIARRIRHDEFYEKVVLPADEPLEAELLEDREAENKPAQSGSQYTWTSSKNQGGAASPTAAGAEEDEDVSSPAKDAREGSSGERGS